MKKQPIVLIPNNDSHSEPNINYDLKKTTMNAPHMGVTPSSKREIINISSPVFHPKNHVMEMTKVIKKAKDQKKPIQMPKDWLTPYIKNKHLVNRLFKEDVDFLFVDYCNSGNFNNEDYADKYDQDDVKIIYRFMHELENQKKKAKKLKLEKEVKKIKSVGNPELNSSEHIKLTNRKKAQKALFDENNIAARRQIVMLKSQGYTDSKVTVELNNSDIYTTPRGNSFHPKQIARLWNSYQELVKYYDPHPFESQLLKTVRSGNLPDLPIREVKVEENVIWIRFKEPINESIEVRAIDNQDNKTFHYNYVVSNLSEIGINVLESSSFILPGKCYLLIRNLNYQEANFVLTIRPDFLFYGDKREDADEIISVLNIDPVVSSKEVEMHQELQEDDLFKYVEPEESLA